MRLFPCVTSTRFPSGLEAPSLGFAPYPDEVAIDPLLCKELFVRAVLHDGSVVQHEDLVGMFDGCQPVGYHDHGLSLGEFRKRRLDQGFVLGVYACRP